MEKEWIEIARKYMPDLTEDQEHFIKLLAKCPYHNGEFERAKLFNDRAWTDNGHLCSLDLIVTAYNIKEKIRKNEEKESRNIINNNPYKVV